MLYMREDDMDEMLRKAAENYEIDAAKAADWNFVYKAVHESEEAMPGKKEEKRRRFIFWWLLLIPLGWLAHTAYNKFQAGDPNQQNPPSVSVHPKANESINNINNNGENQLVYKELIALIRKLSPAYKLVFNLYVIDGYTHQEISNMLGISVGTSKSNLSKARAFLQRYLVKDDKGNILCFT